MKQWEVTKDLSSAWESWKILLTGVFVALHEQTHGSAHLLSGSKCRDVQSYKLNLVSPLHKREISETSFKIDQS